ncbi:MAG: indole-3-glycerol phosphate synthase TrpC [Gemmatimonadaceae bacterium]
MDRPAGPTEHLPNSYVSRRSTEAQAFSAWTKPTGTLGELTDEAAARAATLRSSVAELRSRAETGPAAPSFAAALRQSRVAIIAEVKRSSPSKGVINQSIDVVGQVRAYESGGASAISILTEPKRFSGSNDDLVRARGATPLPLLKKDFHVDPAQLFEAKILGASAALVIVRAVEPSRFRDLLDAGRDVGLEILVEIRDEAELELALINKAEMIGVNNRNLETLEIDAGNAARIIPFIPKGVVAIAESGVKSAKDVSDLAEIGADAVLVGSELSAAADPESAVRALTKFKRMDGARKG